MQKEHFAGRARVNAFAGSSRDRDDALKRARDDAPTDDRFPINVSSVDSDRAEAQGQTERRRGLRVRGWMEMMARVAPGLGNGG